MSKKLTGVGQIRSEGKGQQGLIEGQERGTGMKKGLEKF